jgi:16S rRNA (guanine1207-N2)-methyltransferase
MSGAPALPEGAADLALDPGVLTPDPTLEFHGWTAAAQTAGTAILTWRSHAREAAGVSQAPTADGLGAFRQVVVRIGKGRKATEADLSAAWSHLAPGGRLVLIGHNDVGIATWAKRTAVAIGQPGSVLANRAHSRAVAFTRLPDAEDNALPPPAASLVPLPSGRAVAVAPGVFSGDGLDAGTALLLSCLAEQPTPAGVADVGCGAGHLGIAAAELWPAAHIRLLDADHRAVVCARGNLPTAECHWWDELDLWPAPEVDLALLNPPCHAGTASDVSAARRLFAAVRARRLLVVANRQLPYEADLARLGALRQVADDGRFKVLEMSR